MPPEPPRIYARTRYEEIAEARARGVTWREVAALMTAAGVRCAASGRPLNWLQARNAFHGEKRARQRAAPRA